MKTEIVKRALPYTPEILLLIAGIVCFLGELISASSINGFLFIGVLAILALLIWKNKFLALSIAVLLGGASVFFLLALLSEFSEFPTGSPEGWQMLFVGGAIFGSLLAVSFIMPKKYLSG
ncbi:hypothetical protein [Parapedobacter pyrenivorans]|uniref:hypothetical protein n=1 Tax=Parapedobacter pyrenivorans TaxID=1305674 RepID=UPI00333F319C